MDIETSWADWLDRWDVQQTAYIRARERRFDVMFELLEAQAPPEPTVLDLASGPGPLSRRLLPAASHGRGRWPSTSTRCCWSSAGGRKGTTGGG